jgi:hypothetical protein
MPNVRLRVRTPVAPSEREWQAAVVDLACLYGWRIAHFRPGHTARGWRTPVAVDGAGFPDLVLVRDGELVFAEPKGQAGRVTPAQRQWLDALERVPRVRAEVWRPSDFDRLHELLRRPAPREAA